MVLFLKYRVVGLERCGEVLCGFVQCVKMR